MGCAIGAMDRIQGAASASHGIATAAFTIACATVGL
jgi:hypothetical protein